MSKLLSLIMIIISTGSAIKLEDPRTMQFPNQIDFTPAPVDVMELSNGIIVFLLENHELPLVDIVIAVEAGENRVDGQYSGLSQILADLIVEGGSQLIPVEVFKDTFINLGARFYVQMNSEDYYYRLHTLSRNLEPLLPVMVDAIRNPALPLQQLEESKRQYLVSYRSRNLEPSSLARRVFWKLFYGKNSPQAREATPQNLGNISAGKLKDFHVLNYRPSQVMIGVVGDFNKEEIMELLEQYLGDWQEPGMEPGKKMKDYQDPALPGIYLIQRDGAVQSNIMMGHPGLVKTQPGYPESLLLSEIYGLSRFSRMRLVVREEHGLSYSPYGWFGSGYLEPGGFITTVGTKSGRTIEALKLILEIMEMLKIEGISREDLYLSKSSWLASFPARFSSSYKVLSTKMRYAGYDYPLDFLDGLPERIEPLQLTDINAFASQMLKPDELIILVVGDSTSFDGSLSELGEVIVIDSGEY